MGSIVRASCNCGYEIVMPLGGGMMNFTTYCNFPYYCKNCRILFEANLLGKRISCRKCHGKDILPYDDNSLCRQKGNTVFSWHIGEAIEKELILTDGKYLCPKCGDFGMSFSDVGNWD
jgi:hypothetical protein